MSRRIVYFIHSLREAGTTVQAINYCNAAAARGYDVTLVSAFDGGAFANADTIKCNHISLGKPRKLDALFGIFQLLKLIRHNKPDVMISGAKRVNLWAVIANLISRNKTRLIVTLTNDLEQKTRKRPKGRRLEALVLRKIYQLADMCLVLTPAMRTALVQKGYPKHKLSLAPLPIDLIKVRERSDSIVNHPWLSEKKKAVEFQLS